MNFEVIVFLGAAAMDVATVKDLAERGYRPVPSLVRYADDDMESPSCSDWMIPGAEA